MAACDCTSRSPVTSRVNKTYKVSLKKKNPTKHFLLKFVSIYDQELHIKNLGKSDLERRYIQNFV